jgi:hypothetical protein
LRQIALQEQLRRERFWRRQQEQRSHQGATHLLDLPDALLFRILSFCDTPSLSAALAASRYGTVSTRNLQTRTVATLTRARSMTRSTPVPGIRFY